MRVVLGDGPLAPETGRLTAAVARSVAHVLDTDQEVWYTGVMEPTDDTSKTFYPPFLGYKDDLDKIQWGLEHPHACLGWFKRAAMVQNGAGVCVTCAHSVRVDVNGEPLRHDRKPYHTSAQSGGARERVPL